VIELPQRRGPAERELNIKREAGYVIAVKNPESRSPPIAGLDTHEEARFPKSLQDKFGGRRFLPVDPPDFSRLALRLYGCFAEPVIGRRFCADPLARNDGVKQPAAN
jgi:hypothetical protein